MPESERSLPVPDGEERVYFRQLLAGVDIAVGNDLAEQMVNFIYLIGDRTTGEAVIVDPAYGVEDLLGLLEADGMRCVGALATHYHPDHVGGDFGGRSVEGITRLLELAPVPIHVQADESHWVEAATGVGAGDLTLHAGGDVVSVGGVPITLVHTPGHTPGSQCFLVDGRLVAGDTLFLDGCGRTDLPGSDPEAMYESLTRRLARIPDDTVLYPGHRYSPDPSASMASVRRNNSVFRARSLDQWMMLFGR